MKKKAPSKTILIVALCVIVYVALVAILVAVESRAEGASITSLSSGFWYSITTLTTVGYGDTYPVTSAGKALGIVFQLLSLGVLAAVVGAFLSLLRGTLLPTLKLRFFTRRSWYLFNERTPSSEKLAAHLAADNPRSIIIFCGADPSEKSSIGINVALPPDRILSRRGPHGNSTVFFMDKNMPENTINADALKADNAEVFVMSEQEPLTIQPHRHLFNPYENCARLYWHKYFSFNTREKIVLIGDGKYAASLLEQALILNIIGDRQHVTYRVFGPFEDFLRSHPFLDTCFAVNAADPARDNLFFSDKPWDEDHSVLKNADRIIVCYDDEDQTIDLLTSLFRYVPVCGTVYAKLSAPFDGCVTFGSDDEIFTHELVIKNKLSELAIRLHNTYLASSSGILPEWSSLSPFLRRSNLAAADHLLYKTCYLLGKTGLHELSMEDAAKAYEVFCSLKTDEEGGCPEAPFLTKEGCRRMEHERWMRFHILNNWQYAPVRDNEKRLHPLLLPFDDLSPEDQAKDDYAWELLGRFS